MNKKIDEYKRPFEDFSDKGEREIRVFLNPNFYDESCIKKAVEDYSSVCKVRLEGDVVILNPEEEIKNLADEFSNYALGLMQNKGCEE